MDAAGGLVLVGSDAEVDTRALNPYLEKGGKAFFLPCARADGWLGTKLEPAFKAFAGSQSVPAWPETRGLSASDLRWRSYLDTPPWILNAGAEIGADGLVGRKKVGKGMALFCQVDPDVFHADEKTYFRYTRWRATRAVTQLLANLGASFAMDAQVFHPLEHLSVGPDGPGFAVGPNGDRSGPQATGPGGVKVSARRSAAGTAIQRVLLPGLPHRLSHGR